MDQLLLRVVLLAAAFPAAVGLIDGLRLLLAVVPVRVVLRVQQAAVLWTGKGGLVFPLHRGRVCVAHMWNRLQPLEECMYSAVLFVCFT